MCRLDLRKDERPLERHEERETERWSVYCVTLDALDVPDRPRACGAYDMSVRN